MGYEEISCLDGLDIEAWTELQRLTAREKDIEVLSLTKECFVLKLELFTNTTVVG
jgi:hypothetical protein